MNFEILTNFWRTRGTQKVNLNILIGTKTEMSSTIHFVP